ncbi:MAG TPA: hypothetical protein VFC21_02790 [Bryobacteraceae bacterium]|nr:hypothetical protein [Bryobacteraceae bacterium]
MKTTILTLVLGMCTLPVGFAQTQSTTSERTEQHTQTAVNPDGTAVHHTQINHEKTDSSVNPDGTSTTVHTQQRNTHTRVKNNNTMDGKRTEHRSSSTTTTTSTSPR